MPAVDPNRNRRAGVRVKHKPKTRVRRAPSAQQVNAATNPRVRHSAPKPTYTPVSQASSNAERRKAETYKRTKRYRRAIQKTYAEQPLPARREIVRHVERTPRKKRSSVQQSILRLHRARQRQDAADLARLHFLPRVRQRENSQTMRLLPIDRMPRTTQPRALKPKIPKSQAVLFERDPAKLRKLGFKPEGTLDKLMKAPLLPVTSAAALAEATWHHPLSTPWRTAKQAVRTLPAIIPGAAEAVLHPAKTGKALVKGVAEQAAEPYSKKVKRIEREGGLADLTTIPLAGAPEAGLLRLGVKTGAHALGKDVGRAAVRTSGGVARAAERATLGPALVGRATDSARARLLARQLKQAERGRRRMDAVAHQAAVANREAGHAAEVTPFGPLRAARQRRQVAKLRGRAIYRLRHDQQKHVGDARKALAGLNSKERRAFYWATAMGIRTPEQARRLLPKLHAEIKANREAAGIVPSGLQHRADMLPDIEHILAAPEQHFTPRLADVTEGLRATSLKASHEDPRLTAAQAMRRRHAPQRTVVATPAIKASEQRLAALRHEAGLADTTDSARRRLRAEIRAEERRLRRLTRQEVAKHGLAEPIYFKSERHAGAPGYVDYALGGQRGAMREDRRYTGASLAHGLQDTSPEVYLRGLARNIKAKHNWNAVADMVQEHRLPELSAPEGEKLSHIVERVHAKGIDPRSVGYFNPRVFRDVARREGPDVHPAADLAENPDEALIHQAIHEATLRPGELPSEQLRQTSGWVAVPAEVLHELERQAQPSGAVGRGLDIAKGKASRAILLTSPPWLAFQVAGNTVQTLAATGGRALNPGNWLGAARWWRGLSHEERQHVGAILGLDTASGAYGSVKLGAASNNALVNAYRALKAHPIFHTGVARGRGPSVSQLNPLELMAAADRTQNNAARILTAYSRMKPEAVRRMGASMSRADRAQARIVAALGKPPMDGLRALARDRGALEQHAEAVDDWLGDYTAMTAAERKTLNRFVMFYPYLRFSVRLALYTLPVKHPVAASILAKLGQLHEDELQQLLGPGGDAYWNLGKLYLKGGRLAVDLNRANPALNALADAAGAQNPEALTSMLPPYAVAVVEQMFHRNTFAGRDWRTGGKAAPYAPKAGDYDAETRARILLENVLRLAYPYREAAKNLPGVQGDDTLLWDPRPVQFKGRTRASILKAQAAQRQEAFDQQHHSLARELLPLIPAPVRDRARAADQRAIAAAEAGHGKAKGYGFGGPASGKTYGFGGSPSTTKVKRKTYGF